MRIDSLFFRLYSRSAQGDIRFAGSAFPVAPNGQFLTCRHVADVGRSDLFIHDNIAPQLVPVSERIYPANTAIDLALVRASMESTHHSYLPLLSPASLLVGESVYSYGFFAIGGHRAEIEQGFFSGKIVNFTKSDASRPVWSLTLPFPVIEGMSGSPVITYHNGPKVVGLAYGNRSSRILASEVVEYEAANGRTRETVHRIVEFGLAYHVAELAAFLTEAGVGDAIISTSSVQINGLE